VCETTGKVYLEDKEKDKKRLAEVTDLDERKARVAKKSANKGSENKVI
jgi:hypothetical protein